MLKIRLARYGKKRRPYYRLVVADSEKPRDGKFIEIIGWYDPMREDKVFEAKKERVEYWNSKGAKATETVANLLGNLR